MRKPSKKIITMVEKAYADAVKAEDNYLKTGNIKDDIYKDLINKHLKRYYGITYSKLYGKSYTRKRRSEILIKARRSVKKNSEYNTARKVHEDAIENFYSATMKLKSAYIDYRNAGGEFNGEWYALAHEWDDND